MKIKEVIDHLEGKFPLRWQEDFDNSGIQCGDKEREVSGVLVCFDMSEAVIEEAIEKGANMVISHHPIIYRNGLKKIEPTNRVGKVICKALENKIFLYSMHTNMDSGIAGGNDLFAEKLGLINLSVLSPQEELNVGLGRIGELSQPMKVVDFLAHVKTTLQLEAIRYAGDAKAMIKKVAVCGGGGGGFVQAALDAKADAYLTGDIKYHDFFIPENKMMIVDVGHFEGESFIREIIYSELKEFFPNFASSISQREVAVVHYL